MADHHLARELALEILVPSSYEGTLPEFRRIKTRKAGSLRGHLWEQFALPRHARGGIISLCNTGPVQRRKQIICIHDLNPLVFPKSYSLPFRIGYSVLLPMLGRVTASTATVSEFSAKLLLDCGIVKRQIPLVIPDGHEHVFRWDPGLVPELRLAAGRNTIVLIGSLALHKNISIVLQLESRLSAHGLNIAVVGTPDARVFSGGGTATSGRGGIIWLGALGDNELAALLRSCLCLAFPSLMEGFGLPPLEAMALGCPVVASTCASLPEVCGDAALYASPSNANEWLDCFISLREQPALRQELISKGKARAANFSWRRSAELYLQALARIDGVVSEGRADAPAERLMSAAT